MRSPLMPYALWKYRVQIDKMNNTNKRHKKECPKTLCDQLKWKAQLIEFWSLGKWAPAHCLIWGFKMLCMNGSVQILSSAFINIPTLTNKQMATSSCSLLSMRYHFNNLNKLNFAMLESKDKKLVGHFNLAAVVTTTTRKFIDIKQFLIICQKNVHKKVELSIYLFFFSVHHTSIIVLYCRINELNCTGN